MFYFQAHLSFLFILSSINSLDGISVTGTISLDMFTFDKIIQKFKAVIVKFDSSYPYGDKHDEFLKFAKASTNTEDFIAAEIHIQDYGERENSDLADRFSVPSDDKEKFPFVKLFLNGDTKSPIDFLEKQFTAESLRKFVRKNADVYFGLEGCLESYDKLSRKFMGSSEEEMKVILKQAKDLGAEQSLGKLSSSQTYIKLMERVIERGKGFIDSEQTRLQNIMKEKITKQKRNELQIRLNILDTFITEKVKDEL